MNIEIISIGDELLKGRIVNTNAAFLCRHLQQSGYHVARQMTLSDQSDLLAAGLREALSRSDLVISTGGLGPTLDDRTREIAAEIFDCEFHFDQKFADELKQRYGDRYHAVEDQARIPRKGRSFAQPCGFCSRALLHGGWEIVDPHARRPERDGADVPRASPPFHGKEMADEKEKGNGAAALLPRL